MSRTQDIDLATGLEIINACLDYFANQVEALTEIRSITDTGASQDTHERFTVIGFAKDIRVTFTVTKEIEDLDAEWSVDEVELA